MSNATITTIETHTPPSTSDNVRTNTTAHNSSSSNSSSSNSDSKEGEEEKHRLLSTDNSNNNNHREQADEVISSSMLRPSMSSSSSSGGNSSNSNSNSNSNSGGAIQRKSVSSGHGNSNEGVGASFSDNGGGKNRVVGSSSASLNGNGFGSSMNSGNASMPAQRALAASNNLVVGKVKRDSCGTQPFDKRWLNKDCCGLFCAGFTYSLHIYGCFAVCFKLLKPWFYNHDSKKWGIFGIIHIILFCSIAALACANHFLAMTSDPGAVPPDAVPLPDPEKGIDEMTALNLNPAKLGRRFCRRCNAYKPKRAHHCSICKRCVVKMDHHCPWVNNCVGIGNHKFFLLFIFYTFLSCIYSFSLLLWRGFHCSFLGRSENSCIEKPGDFGFLVGLAIEALFFGLFTSCMIVDQHETVSTNLTQIDRLKGEVHSNLPDVNEVFGGNGVTSRCRLDWLIPVAVKFPSSIRDEIYGFCRPCINASKQKSRGDVEMGPINKPNSFEVSSVDIV